jgi:hypothetical protein
MPKFGGPGTLKKPCDRRLCEAFSDARGAVALAKSSSGKAGKDKSDKAAAESKPPPASVHGVKPMAKRVYSSGKYFSATGTPVTYKATNICAVCDGAKKYSMDTAASDYMPILLCDGVGCSREYHLKCAGLDNVPEGEYFCDVCSVEGTSSALMKYLVKVENERYTFDTTEAYVADVLSRESAGKNGGKGKSELDMVGEWRDLALRPMTSAATTTTGTATSSVKTTPDRLIGQSVRLYLPDENVYHTGRIVDHRFYEPPVISCAVGDVSASAILEGGVVTQCEPIPELPSRRTTTTEYLVRFPSGVAGRKIPVHRWLLLEEHALSVGVSVVWAKPPLVGNKNGDVWPVQIVARSKLERVLTQASPDKNTLSTVPTKEVAALGFFFGEASSCFLPLHSCATDFTSSTYAHLRKTDDDKLCLAMAMASVELEEQRRVNTWRDSHGSAPDGEANGEAVIRALQKEIGEERGERYSSRPALPTTAPNGSGKVGKDARVDNGKKMPSIPPASNPLLPRSLTVQQWNTRDDDDAEDDGNGDGQKKESEPKKKKQKVRYNTTDKVVALKGMKMQEIAPQNIARLGQQRDA